MRTFPTGNTLVSADILDRAFEATSQMSLITDAHQNIVLVGALFTSITGYSADEVLGLNCRLLQGPGTDRAVIARMGAALRAGEVFEGDILNYRKDGSPFWNGLRITQLRDLDGEITHHICVQTDINTRRAFQNELQFQALHDDVTELPNRRSLYQHLAGDRTCQTGDTAIGIINIDNFRVVNDSVGLRGGDELLRALGRRLRNLASSNDFLASMNGDEFVIVCDGVEAPQINADVGEPFEAAVNRLHEAVERPFQVLGESVTVSITMGIAFCTRGQDIDACLRAADSVLQAAKKRQHGQDRWWHVAPIAVTTNPAPSINSPLDQAERIVLRERMHIHRTRLLNGGLAMYMQPIIDLRTGGLSRVEALARLILVDGTVIGPDQFLPALDDADHDNLFRLGLDDALRTLARWDTAGLSTRVSVNLSPSTLYHPDCAAWVNVALRRHGIAPSRLTLELLETQAAQSSVQATTVDALLQLGIGLALDDLGSGHAMLNRLSELPFHSIKLDRGLLSKVATRPVETLSMLATLTQLGRDFKVSVVMEGLEEAGLTEAAAVLGVPFGQGYHIARPMLAASIPDWVAAYTYPGLDDVVSTPLGALAYHWKFLRWDSPHPLLLEECPLTAFLHQHTPDTIQTTTWHEQQHDLSAELSPHGQQLQDWLVDLVQRKI
jgi:diguanylate cyclase (GGDEF)-like protein/PAS domain S-box-containing protein